MDINKLIENIKKGNILEENILKQVCEYVKDILIEESNVQPVKAPVIFVGDIHGQFYDLLKIFEIAGYPPESNYIFMGDYVDRGYNSVETFELLLLLKIKYPSHITLLRGNHESRQVSMSYGFLDEIIKKYGNNNPWNYCVDVFDYLPLGAIVNNEILSLHGGLSPSIKTIDQIRTLDRIMEIPHEGPFSDLMWSDPDHIENWSMSARGAGWLFGSKATKDFNHLNNLSLIVRSHQLVNEGYQFWFPNDILVTVWSAPNYCYRCGNEASILKLDSNLNKNFVKFTETHKEKEPVDPKTVLPYFL